MEREFNTMPVTTNEMPGTENLALNGDFMMPILIISLIVTLVMLVVYVVSCWKIYTKAGKPGWSAIVPVYNIVVLMEIIGRPKWWVILWFLGVALYLIPFVGWIPIAVLYVIISLDIAKSFGKGTAFAIFGLMIFSFVGYIMLAFGKSSYIGPRGKIENTPPAMGPTEPPQPMGPVGPNQY